MNEFLDNVLSNGLAYFFCKQQKTLPKCTYHGRCVFFFSLAYFLCLELIISFYFYLSPNHTLSLCLDITHRHTFSLSFLNVCCFFMHTLSPSLFLNRLYFCSTLFSLSLFLSFPLSFSHFLSLSLSVSPSLSLSLVL